MEDTMTLIGTEPADTNVDAAADRPLKSSDPVLVERVRAVLKAEGLSQSGASKQIGVSSSALSQWLSDSYRGDIEAVEAKVKTWLDARDERVAAASVLPTKPSWFPSPTARKIVSTLQYAQMMGDLVVIYGGAGLGKTVTLEHYRASNPSVWIATMAPDTKGVVSCLEEVAEAVGIREVPGGTRKIARLIRKRIDDTRGLLVIDEAQHLSLDALEELRSIQDATGVGLALVGNEIVYNRLTGGNRGAAFSQLFSRIGLPLPLARPTTADVRAMAEAWGVKGKDEVGLLEAIASKSGALRMATKVLVLSAVAAAGEPITVKHMQQAWRSLGHQE